MNTEDVKPGTFASLGPHCSKVWVIGPMLNKPGDFMVQNVERPKESAFVVSARILSVWIEPPYTETYGQKLNSIINRIRPLSRDLADELIQLGRFDYIETANVVRVRNELRLLIREFGKGRWHDTNSLIGALILYADLLEPTP